MDVKVDKETDIGTNLNIDNNIQIIFEQIATNPHKWNKWRQCDEMIVPPNIGEIQPGQYCELCVSGGGYYCQWYYYQTIDRRHMLIFRTPEPHTKNFTYSGREIDERPKSFGPYTDFVNAHGIEPYLPTTTASVVEQMHAKNIWDLM